MVKFRHAKMHVHHSDIFTSDKKANRHLASREHKDTVFRIIFRDKKKLLQLYNALNDSQYEDEQDLMVTTLDSVIYLSYKNDTSFLLDHVMFLGEHQASWNNNMPLRGMFYFARLYQEYVDACGYDLYSSKEIPLPFPMYVVFYNGLIEKPEKSVLKLSDALQIPEQYRIGKEWREPAIECTATVLNINYGRNKELLAKCQPLMEYAKFVYYVRENQHAEMDIKSAVITAIDQCLEEKILVKELTAYRKEVIDMFILEHYDEEFHRRKQREEIREELIEEIREEFEEKVREELKEEMREEFEEKMREEFKEKMREELKEEMRKELEEKIRRKARGEIRKEVEEELHEEMQKKLNKMRGKIEKEIREEHKKKE